MSETSDGQPHGGLARRVVVIVVVLVVAGWSLYDAFARAKDTAGASCLASVHAALVRRGVPAATATANAQWEEWPRPRVDEALATVGDVGDCSAHLRAQLRTDLRVRSRVRDGAMELELWLAGRPNVRSPYVVGDRP